MVTSVVKQPAGRTRKPEQAAPKNFKGILDFLVDSGSAVHVVPPEAAQWGNPRRDLEQTRMVDVQGNDIDRLGATDLELRLESTMGCQRARVTAEVANVTMAVLSVGRLIRQGFTVVYSAAGSYICRGKVKPPNKRVELTESGGVFLLPSTVTKDETGQDRDVPMVAPVGGRA